MPDSLLPVAARQTSDGVASLSANVIVGNSAAEAVVIAFAIPANSLAIGTTYEIEAAGHGAAVASPPFLELRMRYGGLTGVQLSIVTVTPTASAAPSGFFYKGTMTCRVTGTTGAAFSQGYCLNELSSTYPNYVKQSENNAAAPGPTINTTVQSDLVLTAKWSALNAGSTLTFTNANIQLIRA